MQRFLYPGLLLFVLVIFISCDKSSLQGENIYGKWNLVYDSSYKGVGAGNHPEVYTGQPGDYFDFRVDKNLYIKEGVSLDTLPYSIVTDSSIIIATFQGIVNGVPDTTSITWLFANQVTLNTHLMITPGGEFFRKAGLKR